MKPMFRIAAALVSAAATAGIVAAAAAPATAARPFVDEQNGRWTVVPAHGSAPQKYCVSDAVTGTRLPQIVCRTEAGWAEEGVTVAVKPRG